MYSSFPRVWMESEVRGSVANVHQGVQERVFRKKRTSPDAGAFKYESRFEARITQLIDSPLWPIYLFRFDCVELLDSFSKFHFPTQCSNPYIGSLVLQHWPCFLFKYEHLSKPWRMRNSSRCDLARSRYLHMPLHFENN